MIEDALDTIQSNPHHTWNYYCNVLKQLTISS